MLKRRYQVCLLIAVVLAIFYPALFGEFNSIDDTEMVSSLLNMTDWSLGGVFIPKAGGGLYYRPLLHLTFIFDRFVWFLSSSFMHLENIIFHLANTLLVYFIARELIPEREQNRSYLPLVAGLLFGVHPITTEPVNWISGRTDVMAGMFVLSSTLCLLKFKSTHNKRFLVFSFLSFLMGMLSKETALAFLPGAFLILISRNTGNPVQAPSEHVMHAGRRVKLIVMGCLLGGAVLVFIYLRSAAFTSNSSRITMTIRFLFTDLDNTLFVSLRAFGFYMKKIFYPFPLNFAIEGIDPLYEILALPILMTVIYAAYMRTLVSSVFITGVFLISPAFLIAFNQIAWTPYAERYIYIATAFITTAFVVSTKLFMQRISPAYVRTCIVVCLIVIMSVATFRRNLVWRTNLDLFKDSVEKSPLFSKVWNEYGVALYNKGDIEGAKAKFAMASSLYNFEYDDVSGLNLAYLYMKEGNKEAAIAACQKIIEKSRGKSSKAYEFMIYCYEDKLGASNDKAEKNEIVRNLIEFNEKLYALKRAPFTLYTLGRLSLIINDRQKALEYFRKAYRELPEGDVYKGYAKKIVIKLEKK